MISLFLVAAAAIVAASLYLCAVEIFAVRYRRLAHQRRADGDGDLQLYFCRAGVHGDVLAAVHQFFQRFTAVRGFPVRPTDDLLEVYGMQREDVRDAVAVLAADTHCLSANVIAPATAANVATVEDLVYVVDRLHREHSLSDSAGVRRRRRRAVAAHGTGSRS